MNGLIISGKTEAVPGLNIINYKADYRLKLIAPEDMRDRRTRWIRAICCHTTKGKDPVVVKPGKGPDTDLELRIAKLWREDGRKAGAHISIDHDGSIGCHCDLLEDAAYHAVQFNDVSIGIELYQGSQNEVYEYQLDAFVTLCNWLCQRFGIQRQCPDPTRNTPIQRVTEGGTTTVGVFGHRHVGNRGPGDPGNAPFEWLVKAGYEVMDFDHGYDLDFWRSIQKKLGLEQDGIPGPATCDALQSKGFKYGLYDWNKPL